MNRGRRRFLKAISASAPTAALGIEAARTAGYDTPGGLPDAKAESVAKPYIDLGSTPAGDDTIHFRKYPLDLGPAESVTVADMNGDGRLDIICGESWYEQCPTERGRGPRFIKHKFRDLGYTDNYLEDLSVELILCLLAKLRCTTECSLLRALHGGC